MFTKCCYIVLEQINVAQSSFVFLREVVSPEPDAVVEHEDYRQKDLKNILHHEHTVEETGSPEEGKQKVDLKKSESET